MEKTWEEMSAEEKQEDLFQRWLSPKDHEGNDIQFKSPEAEKSYKERVTRIKDAIQMKKLPDRVPVCIFPGHYPIYYGGLTPHEAMYDYDKCYEAHKKFVLDFDPDMHTGSIVAGPGKVYEILDYKLYSWPGHGVAPEQTYQAVEGEYMTADEYDDLIDDPSHFFSHKYLPRVFGKLDSFPMLPNLTGILEIYGVAFNFIPYALPPVQEMLKALMEAGAEALKWAQVMGGFDEEMASLGYPSFLAGFTKAPFDTLGDTLRGTRGIMMDMFRRPDKLLEALDAITPIMIKMGVNGAKMFGRPLIFIPLHKGADGFMSDEQFKTFYWPSLKKVMLGLIDEGVVPLPAAEGGYNSRLDIVKDLPKGKTLWMMDQIDMFRAKETLGKNACLFGNIDLPMLSLGTPEEIKDYAKELIDKVGKGGGYIMANGAFFDQAKTENVKAFVDFSKEYGVYK